MSPGIRTIVASRLSGSLGLVKPPHLHRENVWATLWRSWSQLDRQSASQNEPQRSVACRRTEYPENNQDIAMLDPGLMTLSASNCLICLR